MNGLDNKYYNHIKEVIKEKYKTKSKSSKKTAVAEKILQKLKINDIKYRKGIIIYDKQNILINDYPNIIIYNIYIKKINVTIGECVLWKDSSIDDIIRCWVI